MPGPASKLYAQNLVSLLTLMTSEGEFAPDYEDEVVAGAAVTHARRIVHEPTREAIEGPAEPEPAPPSAEPFETAAARPPQEPPVGTTDPAHEQLDLPFDQEEDQ
jgi:NAD(P) transhydrogenase subunit alpha